MCGGGTETLGGTGNIENEINRTIIIMNDVVLITKTTRTAIMTLTTKTTTTMVMTEIEHEDYDEHIMAFSLGCS